MSHSYQYEKIKTALQDLSYAVQKMKEAFDSYDEKLEERFKNLEKK